jgi:dipeptidyl aminopeptidase/acylaminoacyl peptidase
MIAEMDKPGWYISDWSPDDARLLVGEYISANESYLWIMDVASGGKDLLTPRVEGPDKIAYGGGLFSADGRSIYLTHDKGGEFQQLVHMDLESKKETVLTAHIPWDVEGFDLSKDGRRLAFVTNEDGVNILHLIDTSTHKEIPAPKLPAGQVSRLHWHDNNKDLGMVISSAKAPSDVYSVDMSSGEVHRWTESEAGGLNTATFVEPELIRWKSFDGRTISGFLYKPDGAKHPGKRPVIINIHGGPESQFRPGFMGRQNYYLNELGVAQLFPNVRGSSGYGKSFLKLDNGYQREDSVKDIGALLDWVAGPEGRKANLDPDRIMVAGGSYGGYMTLAVSVHYPERIRCSVDVVGISNFVSFLERTEAYRRDLRRAEYGDEREEKMREFLTSISPLTNAAKINKPLLVIQGANDPRVPIYEAEQIVETVRKNGGTVWYLMAKDEGHGFAKKRNADFQFYVVSMFVREFLLK